MSSSSASAKHSPASQLSCLTTDCLLQGRVSSLEPELNLVLSALVSAVGSDACILAHAQACCLMLASIHSDTLHSQSGPERVKQQ